MGFCTMFVHHKVLICIDCLSFTCLCILSNPKCCGCGNFMQNKNVYKISNKFYQVLLKMTGLKISRKELIRLAMEVNDLAVYQASGLVDRHVYSLKKQDAVKANGPKNNRHYIFSDDLLGSLQASIVSALESASFFPKISSSHLKSITSSLDFHYDHSRTC